MEPHRQRPALSSLLHHFCLLCTAGPGRCETRWEHVGVVADGGPGSRLRGVLAVTAPQDQAEAPVSASRLHMQPGGCTPKRSLGVGQRFPSKSVSGCLPPSPRTHASLSLGPGVCVRWVCSALWLMRNCAEMRVNKCPADSCLEFDVRASRPTPVSPREKVPPAGRRSTAGVLTACGALAHTQTRNVRVVTTFIEIIDICHLPTRELVRC